MSQKYSTPVYTRDIPWWAYDIAIVIGLLGSVWLALAVHSIFWVIPVVLIWGSFIEPRLLTVRRFAAGEGERSLRIAFLSDIHVGPYKGAGWIRRIVRRVNGLTPDLVLLGGDYIYDASSDPEPLRALSGLKARLGVYGILGNHDQHYRPRETAEMMRTVMRDLENASARIEDNGSTIAVVGVTDDWYAETDLKKAFSGTENADAVIAMVHNPDLAPPAAKYMSSPGLTGGPRTTLMLSGHTHGGQIRLPLIGNVPPLPHHLGRTYDRGRKDIEELSYIIGQGLGESGPRARLFCPPQIVVVEMRY